MQSGMLFPTPDVSANQEIQKLCEEGTWSLGSGQFDRNGGAHFTVSGHEMARNAMLSKQDLWEGLPK